MVNYKIHDETWDRVLDWDTKTLRDYHMAPGVVHTRTPESAQRVLMELIHKTGEDEPTGRNLWYDRRKLKALGILSALATVALVTGLAIGLS
jgi:hypothetical protein